MAGTSDGAGEAPSDQGDEEGGRPVATTATTMTVEPFGAALGAEVRGIDLRDAGEPELRAEIRRAVLEHHVLAFPGQHLDDDEHRAFAATLGELYIHPMDRIAGVTESTIGHLVTDKDHQTRTDTWHLDVTYSPKPPAFGVNRCIVAPPAGGDTMWANLHLALEGLSPAFRQRLVGLTTISSIPEVLVQLKAGDVEADVVERWRKELVDVAHPIVRRHPETGRDSLFCVSTTTPIAEMSQAESDAVLGVLERHCADPNITCRWRWHEGDVVVWDERCTSHFAVRDPWVGTRSMRRILVEGDEPIAGGVEP